MEFHELLDKYCNKHNIYGFEGNSGLVKINQICSDIGYAAHQFRFGSPLEQFLSDNPSAISWLLDFIEQSACQEWYDELESHL